MRDLSCVGPRRGKRSDLESHIADSRFEHSGVRLGHQTRRGSIGQRLNQCFRDRPGFLPRRHYFNCGRNRRCHKRSCARRVSVLLECRAVQHHPQCRSGPQRHRRIPAWIGFPIPLADPHALQPGGQFCDRRRHVLTTAHALEAAKPRPASPPPLIQLPVYHLGTFGPLTQGCY